MNQNEIIRAVQGKLGVYVDGAAGPKTWTALYGHFFARSDAAAATGRGLVMTGTAVSARSERVIATLQPEVQPYARELVHQTAAEGIVIEIIQGLRSYAEQDALYAKGRTERGDIVTNARGGHSNHNFGTAFDVGVFIGGKYADDLVKAGKLRSAEVERMHAAVGVLGRKIGLEWGGDWKSFQDSPHFQLRPVWAKSLSEKEMLAELRSRRANGKPYFAA